MTDWRDELQDGPVPNPFDWESMVRHYAKQNRPAIPDALTKDEIRWGDARRLIVSIPLAFVGTVRTEFTTLVQIQHPARTWKVAISLVFENPTDAIAGDTMAGEYVLEYGSGSAKIDTLRSLAIGPFPVVFTTLDTTFDLPFRSLTAVARLAYTAAAGAARVLRGKVVLLCAPITRDI